MQKHCLSLLMLIGASALAGCERGPVTTVFPPGYEVVIDHTPVKVYGVESCPACRA